MEQKSEVKSQEPVISGPRLPGEYKPLNLIQSFKLGVVCPRSEDGTSLMRGVGPLAAMSRQERKLELVFPRATPDGGQYLGWDWLATLDGLFLQRPQTKIAVAAAQTAKSFGLPVWVDFDDDQSSVPVTNEYSRHFDGKEQAGIMARCWALADVVTVTVAALKKRLLENAFGAGLAPAIRAQMKEDKIRVIPNALHWPLREPLPRTRRVVWRGGKSHDGDLMEFLPAIKEVSRLPQLSKWEWHFMGETSAIVQAEIEKAVPAENLRYGWGDTPHQYMGALTLLAPWLVMVPLQNHTFNQCKSPLAWIEATAAGAACLAPDWPSWDLPGVVKYMAADKFGETLQRELFKFSGEQNSSAETSRLFIEGNLKLEMVNDCRWEIIREFAKA